MEKEICDMKHEALDKFLNATDEILDSHEERLSKLEAHQIKTNTQLNNLCDRMDKLIDAIYSILKSSIGSIIVIGIGFIIWYIQKL